MAEAHRSGQCEHYCIVCAPNGASYRYGTYYRALSERKREVYTKCIREVKRAFKVGQPCHHHNVVARTHEFHSQFTVSGLSPLRSAEQDPLKGPINYQPNVYLCSTPHPHLSQEN